MPRLATAGALFLDAGIHAASINSLNVSFPEGPMHQVTTIVAALTLAAFIGATAAPAAQGDTYKTKKAECKKRADEMKFGVHLIKKNRWVKDCIAGRHPA